MYTRLFITALFVIVKDKKQPKWSPAADWLNKVHPFNEINVAKGIT